MARGAPDSENPEDVLDGLLRRAREPLTSMVEIAGFPVATLVIVRMARRMIESNPDLFGEIGANGVREAGTLWFLGEAVEAVRAEVTNDDGLFDDARLVLIPTKVFTVIAYRHPYFDANKRTGFLAACVIARFLGFDLGPMAFQEVEEQIRTFTAVEAPDGEVAEWFLRKVFISPKMGEVRR